MKAEHYSLSLDVDFEHLTFRGTVRLTGEFDTPALRLNAVGLEVNRAVAGGKPLSVKVIGPSQEVEFRDVPAGTRELELDYSGKVLAKSLLGFYRSEQPPGYVLATQFESTGARRVFPCLDRPDQKATFDVDITVDPGLEVIFNTPASDTTTVGGRKRVRFATTPRMATYLIFLAVGKFDALRAAGPGARVNVWTPPGEAAKGQFALELSQRVLKQFEQYYGVPYPLPKLDLISIREFGAGAMENWGAIASRERLLLADERTTAGLRRAIASVAAHEIAHQWFGDLVTMAWWDDIWLNESFASFMSYKVLDLLGDTPDIWSDFLLGDMQGALVGDSLTSTHPIRQPVNSPEEIDQIFDEISYGKGASVLRMLERFVGPEAFRQGVHDYLVRFQYGNAHSEDLWASLEAAAHQPISDLMRRWVERPGHPVLIVHRGTDGIHLEQRRFSMSGDHPRQYWPLPLVGRADGKAVRVLMSGPDITVNVPSGTDLILNEGASGFYRVLYDSATYDRLLSTFQSLSPPERWLLTEDLLAFVASGDVPFARYRSFVEKTVSESDPLVAHGVLIQFSYLEIPLCTDPEFLEIHRRFHAAQTQRLGFSARPGESDMDRRLRESVLRSRLLFDPEFAKELAPRYAEFDRLEPDLRPAVAMAYAQVRGLAAAEDLWNRLRTGDDAEQQHIARALGSFEEPAAVEATLERAGRGEMPFHQIPWMMFEALRHPSSRPVVWKWFRDSGAQLIQNLSGTSFFHYIYEELIACVGSERLEELRTYFAQHPVPGAERGIEKGLEYAGISTRLRARRNAELSGQSKS